MGRDQHIVLPMESVTHADGVARFAGQAPAEEVFTVGRHGRLHGVHFQQAGKFRADLFAARESVEKRAREFGLGVDPGTRFGALLVFEPAIGIGDFDAVQGLRHVIGPGGGRGEFGG